MKDILILFFSFILLSSCKSAQEDKGEIIPNQSDILSLLNSSNTKSQMVIAYLDPLIEETPSPHLFYLRALSLYQAHQYKEANVDIQKSLRASSRDLDYLLLAGQISIGLENYTIAYNYFNLIKSTHKNLPTVLFSLAELSLKLNNYAFATYYLNQIKLNDLSKKDQLYYTFLNISSINGSSKFKIADIPSYLNDRRLQIIYFEMGIDQLPNLIYQKQLLASMNQYPHDPQLLRCWARFLNKVGQIKMAEKVYQQVLNRFENNERLFLEIGQFYMKHRNYTSALLYLNKVKPDFNYFIEVPFLRSICYLYLGDKIHSISIIDSAKLVFKSDGRFYQLKKKYLGFSVDSSLQTKDSLLTVKSKF